MTYLEDLLKRAKSESAGKKRAEYTAVTETRETPTSQVKTEEKMLIDQYGDVKIYKVRGDPLLLYEVPTPQYKGEEKALIDIILDISANTINVNEALFQTQAEKRARYFHKVMELIDTTPELKIPAHSKEFYANAVVREIVGFGLIDPLIADDALEEIMVIGVNKPTYIFHRKHQMMRTNITFYADKDITDLIDRIARNVGRHIDNQSPLLDARLPDGTRVNATIRPISLNGSTITLRKFRSDPMSIIDLINNNTLDYEAAAFLWMVVEGYGALPANMIIAGGTASGKTTTLNALIEFVPNFERIISIEDTAELQLPYDHWIRFEVRPPGLEGLGEITSDMLLKNALRMRPDRIVVGEIRAEEGYTLFSAMNTGHRGAMGTLHSNNAHETLIRLTNPPMQVPRIMLSALNFIVMQQRTYDRRKGLIRRVTEIAEMVPIEDDKLPEVQVLYKWDPVKDDLENTGTPSHYFQSLAQYTGQPLEAINNELKERARVLKELNEKGLRELDEICTVTQNYSLKKMGKF
ncbi:hypothetical protein AUJ14_01710 [Candidatus Micrarchaeota archaeon CG1_02_55_22]|nr:MAG: hypothetical protein AUJ14_01710 [Candidatus Micrarchaeota archaeon CG1_02_55_22]